MHTTYNADNNTHIQRHTTQQTHNTHTKHTTYIKHIITYNTCTIHIHHITAQNSTHIQQIMAQEVSPFCEHKLGMQRSVCQLSSSKRHFSSAIPQKSHNLPKSLHVLPLQLPLRGFLACYLHLWMQHSEFLIFLSKEEEENQLADAVVGVRYISQNVLQRI